MVILKNIKTEYLLSTGFGFAGLILSLLAGIFSGNKVSVIFFNAMITAIIFAILGYVCLFIIKKFVPEIYQIISSLNSNENISTDADILLNSVSKKIDNNDNVQKNSENSGTDDILDSDKGLAGSDAELESEFNTIGRQPDNYSSLDVNENNSGERNIFKGSKIKYEPQIAAQAIRTMMKRDE